MNAIFKIYTGTVAIVYMSLCCPAQPPHGATLCAGDYEPLVIGYDSVSNMVTGYLHEQSEGTPHISCDLYFTGFMDSRTHEAEIYFYEFHLDTTAIGKGTLSAEENGGVRIKSKNMIMPCQNIENLKDSYFQLSHRRQYDKIAIIKSERQYLFKTANESATTKAYLVKYDAVIVVKRQGLWLLIRYLKNEKTERWIPLSSVFLPGRY